MLVLTGELDLAAAPDMRAAGLVALAEPDCSTLVLDVADLSFIDSTGIGTWVELRNHAIQNDQRLQLRSVSDHLARILKIGGLSALFDEAPSEDSA